MNTKDFIRLGVRETTLSGLTYLSRFKRWKAEGYRIETDLKG
jgi:hypothetical protein